MVSKRIFCLLSSFLISVSTRKPYLDLNVPNHHLPFILHHQDDIAKACAVSDDCPYKDYVNDSSEYCWGYEEDCDVKYSYSTDGPKHCDMKRFRDDFWIRADFGFVSNIKNEMKDTELCSPSHPQDSSLVCSSNMRYCMAKNIYMDFREHKPMQDRFQWIFSKGMVGGYCRLNRELLDKQGQHVYPLQSWFTELGNYTSLAFKPVRHRSHCDIVVEKPTILMKLDSGINLYHHFCDFFNLYLSQHVNNSWFGTDNQVVMWDTSSLGYFDIFSDSWKAFTDHPIIKLQDWVGKRVCLREAMFPLLPRMRGGLYYNSYIPSGCVGSNLFRAFSEHFLHRMGVIQEPQETPKIRVTLLERGKPEDETFRKVKNQDELLEVLNEFPEFEVKVVQYHWKKMKFRDQLQITHNSDTFLGMHGAGLLHFLFLPDWAVAFELYNCGDKNCYRDLARLRGLDYITWKDGDSAKPHDKGKHQRYGDNPKFWNWSLDPNEFRVLMKKALKLLLSNPKFIKRRKYIYNNESAQGKTEL